MLEAICFQTREVLEAMILDTAGKLIELVVDEYVAVVVDLPVRCLWGQHIVLLGPVHAVRFKVL
jgi:hypothetical protein